MHLSRVGVRCAALLATLATVAGIVVAAPTVSGANPAPPPNPTNGQITSAQGRKDALASQVGVLGGQIATAQAELTQLKGEAELAEQKVAFAISKQRAAETAARAAKARVRAAAASVTDAHRHFVQYLQASYMGGEPGGGAGSLLTAKNPSALLDQGALERFQADNKLDAIGSLQRATVTKSNADAKARAAVKKLKRLTANARAQQRDADNAVASQRAQAASLRQTLASSQSALYTAQSALATLNNQRTQFVAYQKHQAYLAHVRKVKAEQAAAARRRAAIAAAAAAATARAEARARAAAARKHHRHHSGSGSSSSGGGSSSGSSGGGSGGGGSSGSSSSSGGSSTYSGSPAPSSGGWTAAKGRRAVDRAETMLGVPYAWAGGGVDGPGYGVCDASNGAPNDCYVRGFDCSGLVLYAWGRSWDHYAMHQYSQAGSYHPSVDNLKPGDLIFYSSNGSVSGIHHVAIYKGHGNIIQAPYSGGYLEVSSMYDPGSIFGITRPLT